MKGLFNYRYYILIALGLSATILMFTQSENEDIVGWLQFHMANKTISIIIYYVMYKLIDYWLPKGKINGLAELAERLEKLTSNND